MIIPSIDVMGGRTVQLVGGKSLALEAGDPLKLARRFGVIGEIAVIDLDAALSKGSNENIIKPVVKEYKCRVGGGVRTYEKALEWLDAGAAKIIIGTKAEPQLLMRLPKERLIAALDAYEGEIVVEGWRSGTGRKILDRIAELRDLVGGFLVTFVEKEGRLGGTRMDLAKEIVQAAGEAKVTIAGGVTTPEEIAELDGMGADAQAGMAIYSGRMSLAEAFCAPLKSDRPDGLYPTIVADESGAALGLVYSSKESVAASIEELAGVYHSRKRGLWRKGDTSGNAQRLLSIKADCDRDALLFTVRQSGAFCHAGTKTCFGEDSGLYRLERRLRERLRDAPNGSYTKRLFDEPGLLDAKIEEEARELLEASDAKEAASEAADLIYFALVKIIKSGSSLAQVEAELDSRELKITRRKGDAKPAGAREKKNDPS